MNSQVSNKELGLSASPLDRQPSKARAAQRSYPALTVTSAGASAAAVVDDLEEAVDDWFVGVNGVPLGPIPLDDLAELAAAGHVDAKSLVWRDGFSEWRPLGNFTHLARLLTDSSKALSGGNADEEIPQAPSAALSKPVAAKAVGGVAEGKSPEGREASSPEVAPASQHEGASPQGPTNSNEESSSPHTQSTDTDDPFASSPEQQSPWEDQDDEEDEQPTQIRARASIPPAAPSQSSPAASSPLAEAFAPAAAGQSIPIPNSYQPGELRPFAADVARGAPSARPVASAVAALEPAEATAARKPGLWTWMAVLVVMVLVALGAYQIAGSVDEEAPHPASSPGMEVSPTEEAAKPANMGSMDSAPSPPPEQEPDQAASNEQLPSASPSKDGASGGAASARKSRRRAVPKETTTEGPGRGVEEKPVSGLLSGLDAPQTSGPKAARGRGAGSSSGGSGLNGEAIQRTVTRNTNGLKRSCWQRALRAKAPGSPTSAKIRIALEIESSGKVVEAHATAPKGFPGLGRCLESRVMQWRFPRASGPTSVEVPVMFLGQ